MFWMPPPPRSLLIAAMLLVGSTQAIADIYFDADSEEQEIHLSNLPSDEADDVLIADIVMQIPNTSNEHAPPLPTSTGLPYDEAVLAAARATSLEPALLHAVIAVESNHNPRAVSARGAQGLMQIMPATARHLSLQNPMDPTQNVMAGARYLKQLKDTFGGDLSLALAAYNAGPAAVLRHGSRIPPFMETRHYVPKVLRRYRDLSRKAM